MSAHHNPFLKRRPNPISKRQQSKLAKLAEIRRRWWKDARSINDYPCCGICREAITSFEDLDSDHVEPGKMGGCRNDAEWNLQPAHKSCNREKGSQRKPLGKICERRMGKLMDLKKAERYWLGEKCGCGNKKKPRESLCPECSLKISEGTRHGLQHSQGEAYCEFLQAAEIEVLKWRAKE